MFNYNRAVHDVAVVNAAAYRSCVVPRGARVLRSGRDKVRLGRGTHYFVCTVRGHCQAGMKHYYKTGLCSWPFVPAAFGPGTIGGFCPGSNG